MPSRLLEASIGGGIAVAIVWLLCRTAPRLTASTRAWLWWLAAARFVVLLVWTAPIPLPVLPPADPVRVTVSTPDHTAAMADASPRDAIATEEAAEVTAAREARDPSTMWPAALNLIWLAGVIVAVGLAVRDWRRAGTIVAQSAPASPEILAVAEQLSARLSLRHTPVVRVSNDVDTPLVIGVVRPAVLLPATGFARLSDRQQQMTICHELVHIRRADLRWGCIPAFAEWLFFFHPCARFAAREYALAREAACDAAVLEVLDAAPQEYGRLLVDLGVAQPRTGLAAAGASWSSSTLKRRLVMLNQLSSVSSTSRLLAGAVIAIAAMAIVPVKLVARPAASPPAPVPAIEIQTTATAQASKPVTTTEKATHVTTTSSPAKTPVKSTTSTLHATDQVKTATPQSTAPVPAGKYRLISRVQGEDTVVVGSDVVLFRAPASSTPGAPARPTVTSRLLLKSPVSGTEASKIVDHARTFRKENEAMIWFKRNDHEYIVRDDGTIKELEALVEAVHVSGTREALYSRVLSDERRVARIGAPAPDVSAQLQEIQTKLAALSAQLKSTDTTDAARRQMADLGKQLETLGRNMQQPVFYPKTPNVAWLSLARGFNETEVFAVLDRAITKGVAQQVK